MGSKETDSGERQAASDLSRWQVPAGGKGFTLAQCDPSAQPLTYPTKAQTKAQVTELASEIDRLQNLFYADGRFALLVVLQGMDAAGKDGTVRAVFKETSPLGVRAVSWKAPSDVERAHDYLWRIHQQMPRKGEFMLFNRSHYEDVLVPAVGGALSPAAARQRLRQINDFERMLSENGTVILKFMLHISAQEQRRRLQARVDDPDKRWKFDASDVRARGQWAAYQRVYETLLRATSTRWAPWTVVPADSKIHRNLIIATLVRDKLASLKLCYPPGDPEIRGLLIQ
ncbi:MAG: polyphosphate--nucleotide phosphotransferase [Burkholderiaceae bacterium]|jgi:PPK2 family polyphosphate:nucleotide phosphotransferase|nr:polyphosphate--nucleotide phosphotransferase [Burkholderiaceae bacterium]